MILPFTGQGILREHATLFNILSRVLDPMVVIGITALCGYQLDWLGSHDFVRSLMVYGSVLTVFIFPWFRVYRSWRGTSIVAETRMVVFAWCGVFVAFNFLILALATEALQSILWPYGVFTHQPYWLWGGLCLLGLVGVRATVHWGLGLLRRYGYNQRQIVILGAGDLGANVAEQLARESWAGFVVTAFFDDDPQLWGKFHHEVPIIGPCEQVLEYMELNQVDQVWIALPLRAEARLKELLFHLRHMTSDIRFVPDYFGIRLINFSVSEVAGIPLLNLSYSPLEGSSRFIKELEDKILAVIFLILASPLMLLIAVGVKLTSRGPVMFKQMRHGWDGRPVEVWKFRTMYLHQERRGAVTQATRDDPRITPLGRFLRRTSLDELPQFLNVLQGRMSIVGPRPHAIEHNEKYKEQVDRYMLRHKVKPGITGWAQINGFRGETNTLEKMRKRVEYDLYYIENWSLWLDLKIVFLTAFKGFTGNNAY